MKGEREEDLYSRETINCEETTFFFDGFCFQVFHKTTLGDQEGHPGGFYQRTYI